MGRGPETGSRRRCDVSYGEAFPDRVRGVALGSLASAVHPDGHETLKRVKDAKDEITDGAHLCQPH